jgi:hypothetical protein
MVDTDQARHLSHRLRFRLVISRRVPVSCPTRQGGVGCFFIANQTFLLAGRARGRTGTHPWVAIIKIGTGVAGKNC